jgi:DNA-directed RNA polymerase sigma subunit (sigma70/sigma32)
LSEIRNYYKSKTRHIPDEARLSKYEYILEKRSLHYSLREIGETLGISAERVRQIEETLTEKLQREQTAKNTQQTV